MKHPKYSLRQAYLAKAIQRFHSEDSSAIKGPNPLVEQSQVDSDAYDFAARTGIKDWVPQIEQGETRAINAALWCGIDGADFVIDDLTRKAQAVNEVATERLAIEYDDMSDAEYAMQLQRIIERPLTEQERQQNDIILAHFSSRPQLFSVRDENSLVSTFVVDQIPLIRDRVRIKWPIGEEEDGEVLWIRLLEDDQLCLTVRGSSRVGEFVVFNGIQIRYRNPFAAASWPIRLVTVAWILLVGYFLVVARGIDWDLVPTRIAAGVVCTLFALHVHSEKGHLGLMAWVIWSTVLVFVLILGIWIPDIMVVGWPQR